MRLRGILLLFSCVVAVLVVAALWWSSPDRAERRRARTSAEPGRESASADPRADAAAPVPRGAEPVPSATGLTFSGSLELAGELNELNGRAVWEDGSPVAYALVYLASSPFDDMTRWMLGKQGRVVCRATCDVDGRFRARWAPGSLFSLTVTSPDGHARTLREPPSGEQITVVLSKRVTVLEIEVVSDESGAGIAGATVMLGFRYLRHRIRTRTDADGNFVLERLPWTPRVRRTLQVFAEGFASWEGQIGHPERDGAEQEIHPRLLRGATLRLCTFGAWRQLTFFVSTAGDSNPARWCRTPDVPTPARRASAPLRGRPCSRCRRQ